MLPSCLASVIHRTYCFLAMASSLFHFFVCGNGGASNTYPTGACEGSGALRSSLGTACVPLFLQLDCLSIYTPNIYLHRVLGTETLTDWVCFFIKILRGRYHSSYSLNEEPEWVSD